MTLTGTGQGAHLHDINLSQRHVINRFSFSFQNKPSRPLEWESSLSHELRSISMLRNKGYAYLNYRDEVADDKYDYDARYVRGPLSPGSDIVTSLHKGTCTQTCEIDLGERTGYVPVIQGFSLEFTKVADDHYITEIMALIEDGNILNLALREKDKGWEFNFIVQIYWIHEMHIADRHVPQTNAGMADKGRATYTRTDSGGTPLLKGFSLKYVNDFEGFNEDSHYVKDVKINLNSGRVVFNDGDSDDYFIYRVNYLTLL